MGAQQLDGDQADETEAGDDEALPASVALTGATGVGEVDI